MQHHMMKRSLKIPLEVCSAMVSHQYQYMAFHQFIYRRKLIVSGVKILAAYKKLHSWDLYPSSCLISIECSLVTASKSDVGTVVAPVYLFKSGEIAAQFYKYIYSNAKSSTDILLVSRWPWQHIGSYLCFQISSGEIIHRCNSKRADQSSSSENNC